MRNDLEVMFNVVIEQGGKTEEQRSSRMDYTLLLIFQQSALKVVTLSFSTKRHKR